jgi:hypothetical protein
MKPHPRRYLFGPGKLNEDVDPHLVALWDDNPAGLEPAMPADGRHDVRALARLLDQPLAGQCPAAGAAGVACRGEDGAPARTSNDFYRVGEACCAAGRPSI